MLFVNDVEAGWMAPYGRNLEASADFTVELAAGGNDIRIWFDDLAERDARYFFQLDYLDGPAAEHALPTPVPGEIAAAFERALDAMHFERPAYADGEVALRDRRAARPSPRASGSRCRATSSRPSRLW